MRIQGLTFDRLAATEVTSLVLAALCVLGQAAVQQFDCGINARSHPRGICGDALVRARSNLCALLAIDFPEQFGRRFAKKSVREIYAYPVQAFAKLDLSGKDTAEGYEGLETPSLSPADEGAGTAAAAASSSSWPHEAGAVDGDYQDLPGPRARPPFSYLAASRPDPSKRAVAAGLPSDSLSHAQKRGMVCDCCYNQCLPSGLARYCT